MAPEAHAKLGASGSERWLNCPGSIRLCEQAATGRSSIYAEEGTAAHILAERCLTSGKHTDAFMGVKITTPEGSEFIVDEGMAEAVQVFVDEVNRVREEVTSRAGFFVEEKFHLTEVDDDMYGTNDASILEPFGTLYVFDYKHGAGVPVEVEGNTQFRYYALGALMKHDMLYEDVVMTVVQPRCSHDDGVIRTERLTVEELIKWRDEVLIPGVKATKAPDAPLQCGKWCRWCDAAAICPAQRKWVTESAQATFRDNYIPAEDQNFPDPKGLSPKEFGLVLSFADALKTWCNQVQEYALGMLLHGKEVDGFKLVYGRASRKWIDAQATEEHFKPVYGDEIYKKSLLTPKQMEDKLKKQWPGKKHTKQREAAVGALGKMIETSHPKVMAPVSDKRPPVSGRDATQTFDAVDDDPFA